MNTCTYDGETEMKTITLEMAKGAISIAEYFNTIAANHVDVAQHDTTYKSQADRVVNKALCHARAAAWLATHVSSVEACYPERIATIVKQALALINTAEKLDSALREIE